MLDLLNKYKIIIVVVLAVAIAVLFRAFGANKFESNAKRWAEPSVIRSNIITGDQIGTLTGEKLIINLDNENRAIDVITRDALHIPADSILDKNNLTRIRKHNGPILLFSSDPAVSARIWMVLSQMGYKNIFIFTGNGDNETFKNKFRPDTLVRPEY